MLSGRQILLVVDNCGHRDGAETDDGVRTPAISELPGNRREQDADYAERARNLRVQMTICIELQRENGPKRAE